jgi:hypothetical protein
MKTRALSLISCGILITSFACAQTPPVFASGLQNPSRVIFSPGGSLLVTEAGTAPNSGRISLVDGSANRRTLVDGLPSGMAAPNMDVDGPNGLFVSGRDLYIAIGEGDSFRNGPIQGTLIPNPAGPSSPMYATLLKVNFNSDIEKITTGFSLKLPDHFTLMDGIPVSLSNGQGDVALVTLVSAFRVDRPDPVSIYRNTHLYSLAMLPTKPNLMYAADAGNNAIWQVDLTSGRQTLLVRFANTRNPNFPPGPPTSEAVPTSVHVYGNHLLVTLLSGAPFVPGASRVMEIDTDTNTATTFIASLSSSLDLAYRVKADGAPQWFVLEYSLSTLAAPSPAPGQLLVFNNPAGQPAATGLTAPTSIVLNDSTGDMYILSRTDGTILKTNVGK